MLKLRQEVDLEKGGSRKVLHLKHPFENVLLAQPESGTSGVWFAGRRLEGIHRTIVEPAGWKRPLGSSNPTIHHQFLDVTLGIITEE